MKQALILDIGGVLVDHDDAVLADRIVALLGGGARETILSAFRQSDLAAGRLPVEEVYLDLARRLGAFADVTAFRRVWSSHFRPNREMIAFAADWAKRAPLALCSNTNALHWAFLREHCALDRLGPATLSHECGIEKPDAEIYRLAALSLDAEPDRCLFVDDKPAYVAGAQAVGMKGHLFTGLEALRAALAARAASS